MATLFARRSVRRISLGGSLAALALPAFAILTPAQQLPPPLPTFPDNVPQDFSTAGNSTLEPGKPQTEIQGFSGTGNPFELVTRSSMEVWGVPDPAGPGLGGTPPYFPYLVRQANCSLTRYVSDSTGAIVETDANFQDTLHENQRIPTVWDKFANGCKDPSTGIASQIFASAGNFTTNNGTTTALAYISPSGMTVVIHDSSGLVVSTTPHNTVSTGGVVFGLAAADLNGDGNIDIVVASAPTTTSTTGQLSVFLGKGDGTFNTGQVITVPRPAGSGTIGVTIEDLRGVGKWDLVSVATASGGTSGIDVFLANGDGTFPTTGISGPTTAGGQVAVTADFGNGQKDIATSFGNILIGDGAGNFTLAAQSLPESTSLGVAAGDFNQDGKIDLAFTNSTTATIDVYFGAGSGAFTFSASYPTIFGAQSIEVTDLDGDGFPDLFVGTAEGGFYWSDQNTQTFFADHLNHGDGTFGQSQAYPPSAYTTANFSGISSYYAVGNFTGGKTPDLLTFDFESNGAFLSVLKANGDGTFNRTGINTAISEFTSPLSLVQITAADLNGDGKPDAVFVWNTGNGMSNISVALGNGDGTFAPAADHLGVPQVVTLSIVDTDADGKPDILFVGQANSMLSSTGLYTMINNGAGVFSAPVLVDAEPNMNFFASADVNGDNLPDIVATTSGDQTVPTAGMAFLYLNKGGGAFILPPTKLNPGSFFPGPVAIADVNGDGNPDLIFSGTNVSLLDGNLTTLLGNGNGTFQTSTPLTTAQPNAFPTAIAVADVNGDLKPDVILGGCCGPGNFSYLALGNGDGTFGVASSGTAGNIFIGGGSKFLKLVDINGDGFPDLLETSDDLGTSVIETFVSNLSAISFSPTTTALGGATSPIFAGQTVTLTATVTWQSVTSTPTGTVNFLDGTTVVGSGTLTPTGAATGVATSAAITLGTGAHSITAAYQGDTNFGGSTSAAAQVQVNAPDFAVAASPASQTVSPGGGTSYTLTLTPTAEFTQTVTITCTVSPAGPGCTPARGSVALNGSAASTVQVNLTTTANSVVVRWKPTGIGMWWMFAFLAIVSALYLLVVEQQLGRRSRRGAYRLAFWASAILIAAYVAGCGSSSSSNPTPSGGTPAGNYTVTITGTAGNTTHSTTATLVVQ